MVHAAAPVPDVDEARDNATFEAILWALARPGEIHVLPEPGLTPVALALVDSECTVYADTADLRAVLTLTGAELGAIDVADHVFLQTTAGSGADSLANLAAGDLLYPDKGATVCVAGRIGAGASLRLSGPGIDGTRELAIGGLSDSFWRVRSALCRYPLGVEILVVEGERLVAIPRSTQIEGH